MASLPVEIGLQIYEECDTFTDALNLSSCCSWLRCIWNSNQDALAFHIGLKVIPAFDDALITIRATAIAKSNLINFILHKKIPTKPNLDPSGFSYRVSKPTFQEVISAVSLFTLIDCVLHLAQHGDEDHLRRLGYKLENRTWHRVRGLPYNVFPRDREPTDAHRYRVFAGMYRVFLAGAVLSWAHVYPMIKEGSPLRKRYLSDDPIKTPSRTIISHIDVATSAHLGRPSTDLSAGESAYICKFMPFQVTRLKDANQKPPNGTVIDDFTPLAEYLIRKGEEDFELHELESAETEEESISIIGISAEDHKQASVIQQFMMFQNAYELLRRLIADCMEYDSSMVRLQSAYTLPLSTGLRDNSGRLIKPHNRRLELFMFGCYQPEIFTFPSSKRWVGPETMIYAGYELPKHESLPSEDSLWGCPIPVTNLVKAACPINITRPGDSHLTSAVDSFFAALSLKRLFGIRFEMSEWLYHNSVRRVLYMSEGKAFRETKIFVPRRELLGYPLMMIS
ncbi:hypothetical protein TWF481_000250 [Arthrobotrys musiformis]|uniref:F-box domain-containing protein n=1 Tax=Arthrobotrys musiformis TaxID=47236 RepID=A0AAV9WNN3_9PEZI